MLSAPEAVFGSGTIDRGLPEMRISDLNAVIAAKRAAGVESPHNEIMYLHQKFSFPVACLVFAMLGLALGLNTRKEGKLAGLTLGLAVILIYWGLMGLGDSWTKAGNWGGARGGLPAEWARWLPNIVLGLLGAAAVWWRGRASGGTLMLQAPEWLTRWRRKPVASQEGAAGAATAAAPRTVVVIRIPRLAFPAPRILDRYVSGKYLRNDRAWRSSASSRSITSGRFSTCRRSSSRARPTPGCSSAISGTRRRSSSPSPCRARRWSPCSATIGGLTRTGELTVMRACGVSLYRAALPLLLIGVVWSGVSVPARRACARPRPTGAPRS